MTTLLLFQSHNAELLSRLIPSKDEPIYAPNWIDPNDEVFNEPLKN